MIGLKRTGPALAAGFGAWLALAATASAQQDVPSSWERAFPETDFSQQAVDIDSILSGGVPKDAIPSIDDPTFVPAKARRDWLADTEPVVGVEIDGEARAYPLRVLTWHEIVNDDLGGTPVAVTYCPLCNSAVVFDARVDGQALEFGVSGKLRHSDLIMYDRQTGTWWQQFTGKGIIGAHAGTKLEILPSRLESWASFLDRHPDGHVLVPNDPNARDYGRNPYVNYDQSDRPFLFRGELPDKLPAMSRVVVVGDQAWDLRLLEERQRIEHGDLVLSWSAGQNTALGAREIARGRDVGNVLVQRRTGDGLKDVPYEVTFAFVFHAFHPEGTWHVKEAT
jgi:hypothetical protein